MVNAAITYRLCVAVGFVAVSAAPNAQLSPGLRGRLLQAKRTAEHAQLSAIIRVTQVGGGDASANVFQWAYSRGREHERAIAGESAQARTEQVWDGKRGMSRWLPLGVPLPTTSSEPEAAPHPVASHGFMLQHPVGRSTHAFLRIETDRSPIAMSPIRDGYEARGGTGNVSLSWLADLVALDGGSATTTPEGRIRLTLQGGFQVVELNPKWGYMIDLTQQMQVSRATRSQSLVVREERRVSRATKVGDCWIPTRIEETFLDSRSNGIHRSGAVVQVSQIRPNASEDEFKPIATKQGDTITMGEQTLVVSDTGTWQPIPQGNRTGVISRDTVPAEPPRRRRLPVAEAVLGGIIFATVLANILMWVRRARRRIDYWGPNP